MSDYIEQFITELTTRLLAEQAKMRADHLAKVEAAKNAKRAKIKVGSVWSCNLYDDDPSNDLIGTIVKVGTVDRGATQVPRVWLCLEPTGEDYRCDPEQLVDKWTCTTEAPKAPKPKPKKAKAPKKVDPPKPVVVTSAREIPPPPPPAPSKPAAKKASKKKAKKKATSRGGSRGE